MPDEMQDPRIAMMRDRFMQHRAQQDQARGQYEGGLSLPEQLPQGPVDPRLMMQRQNMMQRPTPPPMPEQAMGQPVNRPMPMMPQRQPMGMPPAQGTPAQMPMANTMNPNAPSARPSMAGRQNMMRGQNRQMGARNQQMGQQQATQRSITPF